MDAHELLERCGRRRGQNGCILKRTGKRRNSLQLHWYVYRQQPDGTERRIHRTKTVRADECSWGEACRLLREIIRIECSGGAQDGTQPKGN
jgi:hypothetical protein